MMGALVQGDITKTLRGNVSATLSLTASTSDSKTKDDPIGDNDSVDYIGGELTLEGKVAESDVQLTPKDLAKMMFDMEPVSWVYAPLEEVDDCKEEVPDDDWSLATTPSPYIPKFTGRAIVTSYDMSAPVDGDVSYSVKLKIQGKPNLI